MSKIQRITDRERKYIVEVLAEEFRSSKGSMMTSRLEKAFAEKFDSNYAIAFCNGSRGDCLGSFVGAENGT